MGVFPQLRPKFLSRITAAGRIVRDWSAFTTLTQRIRGNDPMPQFHLSLREIYQIGSLFFLLSFHPEAQGSYISYSNLFLVFQYKAIRENRLQVSQTKECNQSD